jgi:hypothetical protein
LPETIKNRLPDDYAMNIVRYRILGENTGTKALQDVNLLVAPDETVTLLDYELRTVPPREVEHGGPERPAPHELRYSQITLEKGQGVELDLCLRGQIIPPVKIYWSGGGGNVDFFLSSPRESFGLEGHLIAMVKYYIFAQIAFPLMLAFGYILPILVPESTEDSRYQIGGIGIV